MPAILSPASFTREEQNSFVAWRDDPDGRGTLGLVWSCILTLALCVWSALHLNIPPKHDPPLSYWMRVLRWVLMGVLAPELVLWAAWRQWTAANLLTRDIRSILAKTAQEGNVSGGDTNLEQEDRRESDSSGTARKRRYEWTRIHSFYVCMGGLVFDRTLSTDHGDMAHIPRHRRVTLTPKGAMLLAECGLLPDMDPAEIKDKSKADSLAKLIVLIQASWFLAQAIARLVQQLPVSLLEVNTIGHVLCALVIYILWWQKPREVSEPTVLRGPWVNPMSSFMYMNSKLSGVQYRNPFRPSAWVIPELENLVYCAPVQTSPSPEQDATTPPPDPLLVTQSLGGVTFSMDATPDEIPEKKYKSNMDDAACQAAVDGPQLGEFRSAMRRQDTEGTASRKRMVGFANEEDTEHARMRPIRRALCAQAFHDYPAVRAYFSQTNPTQDGCDANSYTATPEELLIPISKNWPGDYLLKGESQSFVGIVLWFVSIMYGSVHLAAWNEYFPTEAERLLWHMSAGYIAASGVWWTVAHVLFFLWPWLDDWWTRFIHLQNHWLQYLVYGFLMACAGTLYILTRAYLTVEGIVSLRSSPQSTYDTVQWTKFMPHL